MTTKFNENNENKSNVTGDLEWTFNLVVIHPVLPHEFVAVTGGCPILGNWQPENSILMNWRKENMIWTTTLRIPRRKKVPYRYFICTVDPRSKNISIRRWETHLEPRMINDNESDGSSEDIFGVINDDEQVTRGWLLTESIVQFMFFDDPFILPQGLEKHLLYIKITPKEVNIDKGKHQNLTNADPSFAYTEVVRFIYGESIIQPQEELGIACGKDDAVIFHTTLKNLNQVAYLIELFCWEDHKKLPTRLGYNYVLPSDLSPSEGKLELPILNTNKNSPIGIANFKYCIIKPMEMAFKTNLKISLAKHWKTYWTGLDIGHRGSGTSYKFKSTSIPENTIISMKSAAACGADMVEFDVHLTKDLIPIVYHDFYVNISLKGTSPIDRTDLIQIPIKDLTLKQLKDSKIYHISEGVIGHCPSNELAHNSGDCEPFPSLEELFDVIDPNVAFDIEIKWPQQLINGAMEGKQSIDKNMYVNKILEVVLRNEKGRRLVLTSFDVDICAMLRFKQNIYPVMFLALGKTERYPHYTDPRCCSIEKAVCNAQAMDLLGVIIHTEDFLKDPNLVKYAKKVKQVVFCWGDDTRASEILFTLKNMGLDGVIYDRCDRLIGKIMKQSNFRAEAKKYSQLLAA